MNRQKDLSVFTNQPTLLHMYCTVFDRASRFELVAMRQQLSYCTYSIIVPLVPCSMPNHGRCSLAFSITSLQVFLNHKTIKIQTINGIKYKYNVCNLLHHFVAGFPEPLTLIYVAPWVHIEHSFPELRKKFPKNLKTRKMLWCHRPLCYC